VATEEKITKNELLDHQKPIKKKRKKMVLVKDMRAGLIVNLVPTNFLI
jgi:hypothetical protein